MFGRFLILYNPDWIANVISLKTMATHYKVMFNNKDRSGAFIVHAHNKKFEFVCHPRGLHYLDLSKKENAEALMALTKPDAYMLC